MKLKKTGLKMYKASGALPHLVTRDTALTVRFTGWCFTVDGSQTEFHLYINGLLQVFQTGLHCLFFFAELIFFILGLNLVEPC